MPSNLKPANALELFFSYVHEDEQLRNELEKQLTLLKREGLISSWNDRDIKAGQAFKQAQQIGE